MTTSTLETRGVSTYELWEHGQSGEVFAIRLDRRGHLTGCCGPLLSDQIHPTGLREYRYDEDPDDLAWIEDHRESWVLSEFACPPHY